jgi:hypothetical protein
MQVYLAEAHKRVLNRWDVTEGLVPWNPLERGVHRQAGIPADMNVGPTWL